MPRSGEWMVRWSMLEEVGRAIQVGAGLFWNAFWALAFGYAFSSVIQVLVPREVIARYLGHGGWKETALAMLLGPASSSCSFAALSAGRALLQKGAALTPMLAFLFGATNLSPQVAALAWIFLGWPFALAVVVGSVFHVGIMAVVVRLTRPGKMVDKARKKAGEAGRRQAGMSDPSEGLQGSWRDKIRQRATWNRIGRTYASEWRMVWKDILFGFAMAGAVAVLVPDAWFQAIFPQDLALPLLMLVHALLGPVLAIFTIIGSMGNGPLAAVLWENGVLFGGILAFLYADFVVLPSLRINAGYYGWRFAAYLAMVFAVSAAGAGFAMHASFHLLRLIPERQAGRVQELAGFEVDYVFFLNLLAIGFTVLLLWARARPEP